MLRDNGLEPPRTALEARLLSLRLQAAVNAGLLHYTSSAVASCFGTGEIARKVLPAQELRWVRSVGLLHREERYLSPAVRRCIQILTRITSRPAVDAMPVWL